MAKSERDNAHTDSDLARELVQIEQAPSKLLNLKLVGIGKILTGIYVLMFGILIALIMLPYRLKKSLKND